MWTPEGRRRLYTILASLYPTSRDWRRIIADAGINGTRLDLEGSALNVWSTIVEHSDKQGKLAALVFLASEENPDVEGLQMAKTGDPPQVIETPSIKWDGPLGAASLEKIIGTRSTLVSVAYLEVGLERSRSVVRIRLRNGSVGSGFLAKGNYLITNNHVLPQASALEGATVYFNYQQNLDGLDARFEVVNLSAGDFLRTSVEDDWTAVRIGASHLERWGGLELEQHAVEVGEHVNIIQHPAGGPKQVSLSAGAVAYVGAGRVQYLTDTMPGSSGSPVFNEKWKLIALHHAGGWLPEPNSLQKNTFFRNEGIAIAKVIKGLL